MMSSSGRAVAYADDSGCAHVLAIQDIERSWHPHGQRYSGAHDDNDDESDRHFEYIDGSGTHTPNSSWYV